MNRREALNEILLALNEMPLEDSDDIEDIQTTVTINKILENQKRNILARGWNFNTVEFDLEPDSNGYIPIPKAFLSVRGVGNNSGLVVVDSKLFDRNKMTFIFDKPAKCIVIQSVNFDDIPQTIANYIVQQASLTAYINIIGAGDDLAIRNKLVVDAKNEAQRENLQAIQNTVLNTPFISDYIAGDDL